MRSSFVVFSRNAADEGGLPPCCSTRCFVFGFFGPALRGGSGQDRGPESWRHCPIVLRKVKGFQYLHLIRAAQGKRFQIGNNRGRVNGWIGKMEFTANV